MKVGDVVILCDELTKRAFWKFSIVTELLTGRDDLARAAIVKTVNSKRTQLLHRNIKHLILNTINVETSDDSSVLVTNDEHQDLSAVPDLLKNEMQLLVEKNEDDLTITISFLYTCVHLG